MARRRGGISIGVAWRIAYRWRRISGNKWRRRHHGGEKLAAARAISAA